MYDGEIVGVDLPAVGRADRHRDRARAAGRPGVGRPQAGHAETGLVVQVPLFVNTGDRVKVDTRTGEYLTRAGG